MTEYKLPPSSNDLVCSPNHVRAAYAAGLEAGRKMPEVTNEMVSRFLCWPFPPDFYPDGGITFTRFTGPVDMRHEFKPIGTNLLNADQARAMLERVLATAPEYKPSTQGATE